ncbi:transposase [Microbacterium rhizosphaerae]|uniref:Transposase n=1 Tax=Microbacterium rhizosphaerae TaxID=1678237 RepID=A0ABZ0SLR3_9MICO|nr:transposase [Microbacterium rhizosphaerae]WPR89415.1 transposase [Microbacterium rhizosphaerae]
MADASLADIAAELYAGPPDAFVAARNARATEVADSALAAQIKALRKPSIAAWVVNVFAQERTVQLGQALQLAQELREAQDDLDAATLAQLGRQRRALTAQLAREAVGLASSRGERVTPATGEAVQQTITAAFFDADAAAAVASGRLVRELEASTPVDLDVAVGGGRPEPLEVAPPPTDEVKARRERREAEAAVHNAEQEVLRAQRDETKVESEVRNLARRVDDLAARERDLQAQLDATREELGEAKSRAPELDERRTAAGDAVAGAQRDLEAARTALDRLGG